MFGASVLIRNIDKSYGAVPVLSKVNLAVEPGEFLTLLGPSGCGKSTLLRLIAGFETQNGGTIDIDGRNVDGLRPKERGLSMVFQNYALYPHMSVFDNIAMPLVMRRMSFAQRFPLLGRWVPGANSQRRQITADVHKIAELLEIEELLHRKPGHLSGGQRQRVALGRAIVPQPSVFLMDEPLSNLDARLRIQMRSELIDLHRRLGITFIYVTHDQVEAMTMSQRVAVMMDGDLVQVGSPFEVYDRPNDLRVARFIGAHPINVFDTDMDSAGALFIYGVPLAQKPANPSAGKSVTAAVRPDDLVLDVGDGKAAGGTGIAGEIVQVEDHGADLLVHVAPAAKPANRILVRADPSLRDFVTGGSNRKCRVIVPSSRVHLFGEDGARIGGSVSGGDRRDGNGAGRRVPAQGLPA